MIAHVVGHHLQNLLGISATLKERRARVNNAEYNAFRVKLELQADRCAGVWAFNANNSRSILEGGDVASAKVQPPRLATKHCSVEPGVKSRLKALPTLAAPSGKKWFETGLKTGSVKACDAFSAKNL